MIGAACAGSQSAGAKAPATVQPTAVVGQGLPRSPQPVTPLVQSAIPVLTPPVPATVPIPAKVPVPATVDSRPTPSVTVHPDPCAAALAYLDAKA
ncbi:MAG: hypothetical protein M3063_02590, partial [Actinomycetota bacterium]|nr:hypothetical protein [Actinomycetota bacterium]